MRYLAQSLLFLALFLCAPYAYAHDDWCHRWHVCPSDNDSYVCGDMGVCGQCPDNEYCKDNEPVKRKSFFKKPKKENKGNPKVEVKAKLKKLTPPEPVSSSSPEPVSSSPPEPVSSSSPEPVSSSSPEPVSSSSPEPVSSSSPKSIGTKELFKRTRDSVVLIMSFDSNNQPLAIGSGFYVDDGSKIATNLHVVSGAQAVRVKKSDGEVFRASVILGVDSTHDLALLEADVSGKPIPLSQRAPEIGEDVIAIGNPKGLEATLSKGIVSGVRNDQGSVFYQVTAPISPGSSGGPVIDRNGEVIGVSTFYVQGGQNLNFAMPSAYIHKLLRFPNRKTLASISNREPSRIVKAADENVKIVDHQVIGGSSSEIKGSIYNGNTFSINNIRLIVMYYSSQSGQYPVHYNLFKFEDTVPSGLSLRFSKKDYKLEYGWEAKFRILDYDIIQQAGEIETIPDFE